MYRLLIALASVLFAISAAQAAVQGREISYASDGVALKGYLAWDDRFAGKRPGVLVVHEWWGHNEYARQRARMLAEQGYVALAVDMYGDGKLASHPKEAGEFAGVIRNNAALARQRFEAAMTALHGEDKVDAGKTAALGYCFGGSVVLDMARQGLPLDAVVSYHGGLGTPSPAQAGVIKARVASFTGDADPMIPAAQVEDFRQEMAKAGARAEIVVYPGVKHSFTSPEASELGQRFNLPLAYDGYADRDAWARTLLLLNETLGSR
jgi:dienelactone hydrolase